jgi:pyruvate,water dikinase
MNHPIDDLQWNDSLTGDYLWNNTNFGEAVTETMTPISWSVLQFTLDDWTFLPGFATVGNIGGRPYINISIIASLFQVLGRGRRQLLEMLEGTMYMQLPDEMEIPLIPLSPSTILHSVRNLSQVFRKQTEGRKRITEYLRDNPGWFEGMRRRIQAERSKRDLVSLWQKEIRPRIKNGVWTVLGTVNHSSEYSRVLRRELISMVGPEDAQALISNLSSETELLPSLGPSLGVARLANGEISQREYLERYGHRGPHEFELSRPRPVEDPGWLERQLGEYQENPLDVQEVFKKQQALFDRAWERFRSRHPRKTKRMLGRITENARRTRLREGARSEYIRDRWLVRLFMKRAGELATLGEEVFFLTLDETLELLSGRSIESGLISSRRETYQRYIALPPYPTTIRGRFDPFQWAADPNRRSDIYDAHLVPSVQTSESIKGAAGSGGCVEGLARVMAGPEESVNFQPGEILVTGTTDISWTPIFPRAAAVVTDIGAPLSHAAIVARELGIPAVVGCQDATMRLSTGDRIRVDGNAGRVTILERQRS